MTARQRVVGYIRVSTAEQVDGFGLEVQEQAVRAYCRSNGLRLVAMFSDEGLSGSNGLDTRRGLCEALAHVETGQASAVVVYRLDRLAHDLILQEVTIQRLQAIGAAVLSVSEPDTDSDDPTKVLLRQMLGAFGQYERCVIRGRMASGKAAKARGGQIHRRPTQVRLQGRQRGAGPQRGRGCHRHHDHHHAQGRRQLPRHRQGPHGREVHHQVRTRVLARIGAEHRSPLRGGVGTGRGDVARIAP